MTKRYKVGDVVWQALAGNRMVKVKCSICFGKCKVTLILGNDDTVVLPCNYCSPGYQLPSGYVEEYKYVAEPEQKVITAVHITEGENGEVIEYRSGHFLLHSEDIFVTEKVAIVRCKEKAKQRQEEEDKRSDHCKKDKQKSFSWNAGYHLRNAKKYEKGIEYHKRMAVLCKAKVKK